MKDKETTESIFISKNYDSKSLPFALNVTAKATGLDNIKIVPVNEDTGVRRSEYVLKMGNWEKRLVDKCVKSINKV